VLEGLLERTKSPKRQAEIEEQLRAARYPIALDYLWKAYLRLRNRKGGTGFAPSPIAWPDIDAFCRRSGQRLVPWEVEVIERLDAAWLGSLAPPPPQPEDKGG
jgi:hypothetical protein